MMTITCELFRPAALTCTCLPSSFRRRYCIIGLYLGACFVVASQRVSRRYISLELPTAVLIASYEQTGDEAYGAEHSRKHREPDSLEGRACQCRDTLFPLEAGNAKCAPEKRTVSNSFAHKKCTYGTRESRLRLHKVSLSNAHHQTDIHTTFLVSPQMVPVVEYLATR
jgi:hypothetical protein